MRELIIISASTKFYACVVTRKDYLERIDGGGYDQEEYEQYPQKYKSNFNKKVRYFIFTNSRIRMHTTFRYVLFTIYIILYACKIYRLPRTPQSLSTEYIGRRTVLNCWRCRTQRRYSLLLNSRGSRYLKELRDFLTDY